MEVLLNGVDGDLAPSLTGSPSDALFGLDQIETPADENLTNDALESEHPADKIAPDETIADPSEAKLSTDAATGDDLPEPLEDEGFPGPTKKEPYEHIPSIETEDTGAPVVMMSALTGGASTTDLEVTDEEKPRDRVRPTKFEILLRAVAPEDRANYKSIRSDVVDEVVEEVSGPEGKLWYKVEFTDGRQDIVAFEDLLAYEEGESALRKLQGKMNSDSDSGGAPRQQGKKRSWKDVSVNSDDDSDEDLMELDEEEIPRYSKRQRSTTSHRHTRQSSVLDSDDDDGSSRRPRRQRAATRQSTRQNSRIISDHDEHDGLHNSSRPGPPKPQRQLRERTQKQLTLTSMAFGNASLTRDDDLDELSQDPPPQQSDGEDDDFMLVTSDLISKPSRSRRKKSKRLRGKAKATEPRSRGSSIEFEERRRSGRSTRNKASMVDVTLMDEESFYVEETAPVGAPKTVNIKEVFKQLDRDSPFVSYHSDICSTCNTGPGANKGQMIGCQGCSMSFHKACLGYRAGREHIVTKVGVDDFVLQCKFCIGHYNKKDKNGPRHDRCQECRKPGRSCAAFSPKRTPKQEEKIRIDNGGEDPITPVAPSLINNADVMFRCTTCKRGWHYEHLPSSQMDSDLSDIREQRLSEYSVDWKCHDCGTVSDKIQTLVAWRPSDKESYSSETYSDLFEDEKEYLIKWYERSYFHCSWMPGAWVFHIAPGTMRSSFAKKDADQNLFLKMTKADAIPEEYLLADVIFAVKTKHARGRSLADEMERIGSVEKIYVKFQGLGYDEAVWDSPPKPDSGEVYNAFKAAYYEYLTGKYFNSPSNAKMRERTNQWKEKKFSPLEDQPAGIRRGKLMAYQLEGVNWLLYNYHEDKNVILADEMGLGKTVQVVSLISALAQSEPKCWPFLVVVPNSTCPNWRREIKQWAPDLRVVTYHGGKQPQDLAYRYELFPNGTSDIKAHVVVMSYDSAQDDRTRTLFRSVQWAGLVVDEGQRLKNDKSLLYLALWAMRFPFRLLLTGTPLQNNKRELFNLLQFIDPTQNAERLDEQYQELNAQNLPELHGRIKRYFLRRTKAQVLKFLPPMAQIIVPVSMSILQEKLCKSIIAKSPDLIKAIFADDKIGKKERGSLNNILMQLRKCLCHPFMYSEAIEERSVDQTVMHQNLISASGKLMLLNLMLPKLKERGHRVLIFSQFLDQLDIIEDFLNGLGYQHRRLDGKINSHEKQKHIDAFNAEDSPIFAFLLSTRAGGVGINLATADTVIILDPDFNPHQDIQAISRAHRIGQKHKVLCFQLMTKNSAEEKIMQIGRKKMALDHVLIESMDDTGEPDDLESILKFGASALFSEDQNEKDIVRYDDASVEKLLDRSHIEQTKTGKDESAESQFSFARVWANDKGTFEDNLAEESEPTVNPNVWEEILAEREAEAKRIAELNKEVLGRGGRRRQAVNYKTSALITTDLAVDHSGSSDNDGDFVGEDDEPDTDVDDRALVNSSKEDTPAQDTKDQRRLSQKGQDNSAKAGQAERSKTNTKKDAKSSAGQRDLHQSWLLSQGLQTHQTPGVQTGQVGQPYLPPHAVLHSNHQRPGIAPKRGRPRKSDTPVMYGNGLPFTNSPWTSMANAGQNQNVQSGGGDKHSQPSAGTGPYPLVLANTSVPERARILSSGLSQMHPDAPICGNCNLRHLSTQCPVLTSEAQLRLALDNITHWPPSARIPAAETALLERLRVVATNNNRRQT